MSDKQNRRHVFALGETVLDLVSDGGCNLKAIPGGSVLNASVSLARMGVAVSLVSEFGEDKAGDLIRRFLLENKVRTDFCIRHPNRKTSLALAFMDDYKKATYSFYHDLPEQLLPDGYLDFNKEDILLFGSFYSVKPDRRDFVLGTLKTAVQAGSLIYYDLNYRVAHADKPESLLPAYMNNMAVAAVVKGSDEDFINLFGISDPDSVYEYLKPYCKILIITRGAQPVHAYTPHFHKEYRVPEIAPVSTIGAGDNFNAGFIYGLLQTRVDAGSINQIPADELDMSIGCGLAFATETCLSAENYIPGNFQSNFWKNYI